MYVKSIYNGYRGRGSLIIFHNLKETRQCNRKISVFRGFEDSFFEGDLRTVPCLLCLLCLPVDYEKHIWYD